MLSANEIVSSNPLIQAKYEELRELGNSHNMAEMLAFQKFPGTVTDVEFMRGRMHKDQFNGSKQGELYRSRAEAAGVSTKGKFYSHQLARFPGDPLGWVDSRGDVKRICELRGATCDDGLVKYKPPEYDLPEEKSGPYLPADDIVERKVAEMELTQGEPFSAKERLDVKEKTAKAMSCDF